MGNTTEQNGNWISITLDGSTDWDLTTNMPQMVGTGLKVRSIGVYAADGAVIICRDVAAADQAAPKVFHFVSDAGQLNMQYQYGDGAWMKPAFDAGDCGAGTVVFELA